MKNANIVTDSNTNTNLTTEYSHKENAKNTNHTSSLSLDTDSNPQFGRNPKSQNMFNGTNPTNINKTKKTISLSSLFSNVYGLKEASTQTDLTFSDIQRLEDIRKSYNELIFKDKIKSNSDLARINPYMFHTITDKNNSLLKRKTMRLNKEDSKSKGASKKKSRGKKFLNTSEIKIFNSVVVNNDVSFSEKKYLKKILSEGKENDFKGKLFNLVSKNSHSQEANGFKPSDDEASEHISDIGEMINKIRQNGSESNENHESILSKEENGNSLHMLGKLYKGQSAQPQGKKGGNKNFSSSASNNLDNISKRSKSKSKIETEERSNVSVKFKDTKRKFDPFYIFLNEFRTYNQNLKEHEMEREAKTQWLSLDKDTRKIYNMHADREKKMNKCRKRANGTKEKADESAEMQNPGISLDDVRDY